MSIPYIQGDQDCQPLAEFETNVSDSISRVHSTKRPLFLIRHGKATAVLIDPGEFGRIQEELEVLRDIQIAERQIERGEVIDHAQVKAELLEQFD